MVSSISSTSSYAQLFSKLDTKSQGYLEYSDIASALGQVSTDTSNSVGSELFAVMDSDQDGKVTESEFSSTLTKLQEQLESQLSVSRMPGSQRPEGMGGMPPPPPPENDEGFTKDELSSQLDEIGSSDSQRSDFISNVVNNFEAADTDSDGKVTFAEAKAYNDQSSDSSSTNSSSASAQSNDDNLIRQVLELLRAYSGTTEQSNSSSLSISA